MGVKFGKCGVLRPYLTKKDWFKIKELKKDREQIKPTVFKPKTILRKSNLKSNPAG